MRVKIETSAKDVSKRLLELLKKCESFSWASAWATDNDVVRAAIKARKKMTYFVIGTHRYITDPKVLDNCRDIKSVKIWPPTGILFHPKVYAFDLGTRIEVYVGSSNLTSGGLYKNTECGVFISAECDHPKLMEFLDYVEKCYDQAEELTPSFIVSYKANKKRVKDAEEELKTFTSIKPPKRTNKTANNIGAQEMEWSEFVKRVRNDKVHSLDKRLVMLSAARSLASRRFDTLTKEQRKCVAGLVYGGEKDGIDWGWFGQMTTNGGFHDFIASHYRLIAKALDHIPVDAPVKKRHYDAYLEIFKSIPKASESWRAMGTRLLAMRRPDQFVCIDGPNIQGVAGYLGASYSTINLDNYWERIIEQVRVTPWYLHDEPLNPEEKKIWRCRTALLDSIYYDPTSRKKKKK